MRGGHRRRLHALERPPRTGGQEPAEMTDADLARALLEQTATAVVFILWRSDGYPGREQGRQAATGIPSGWAWQMHDQVVQEAVQRFGSDVVADHLDRLRGGFWTPEPGDPEYPRYVEFVGDPPTYDGLVRWLRS